ncbi:MAG: hypothetical protein JXR10_15090 [Cyclobacteriaceae bacterium]
MTKRVGIFGFGTKAREVINLLQDTSLDVEIAKVWKDSTNAISPMNEELVTYDSSEILLHPEIDLIIELVDDSKLAYEIAKEGLSQGKAVFATNIKMLAEHLDEIIEWSNNPKLDFNYEIAARHTIPFFQHLSSEKSDDKIMSFRGILNGEVNHVLSQMRERNISFGESLSLGQANGRINSDLEQLLSGKQDAYQLIVLAKQLLGETQNDLNQMRIESITNMEDQFYEMAASQGLKIKLVGTANHKNGQVTLKIQPEVLAPDDLLYDLEHENLGLVLNWERAGAELVVSKSQIHPIIYALSQLLEEINRKNQLSDSQILKSA